MNPRAVNSYRIGGACAVVLHACAATAVALLAQAPAAVALTAPLQVSLIVAEPDPAPPAQEPPRPRSPRSRPLPQPLLAALPAAGAPPADAAPAAPAEPAQQAASAAAASEAAPVVVAAPRFDADYLDNPRPPYPSLSRRLGEQGRVLLRVLVNTDGTVAQAELKSGSGSPRLDQSALDTVRRWRFIPARHGALAVAAWVQVPIVFTLGA